MKPSAIRVLEALQRKKRKGVTFDDFPTGTDLRTRLCEIRDAGYLMVSEWEMLCNGGRRKRWWLIKEPKV